MSVVVHCTNYTNLPLRVPEDISYMAAKKTELILCKYDEELVFDTTQALGVFYNWVSSSTVQVFNADRFCRLELVNGALYNYFVFSKLVLENHLNAFLFSCNPFSVLG